MVKPRDGPWERYILTTVLGTNIGLQVVLKKYPSLLYEQIVYLSSLDRVVGVKFEIMPQEPMLVIGFVGDSGGLLLPIPCVVRASVSTGDHKAMLRDKIVTFFGYSSNHGKRYIHLCLGVNHYTVDVSHISWLRFLRGGAE